MTTRKMRARRWTVIVLAVLALLAAAAITPPRQLDRGSSASGSASDTSSTALAPVERQTLSERTQVTGTLGYSGSYVVLGPGHGTVTALPAVGHVVNQGQVLYWVDGTPVILMYGATAAYRPLAEGVTGGKDVTQLNRDLVALGYVAKSDVDSAWSRFGWATKAGVIKLQKHLGVPRTGSLPKGDLVFLPTAARVTALPAELGAPAGGPILRATSTTRTVSVTLSTDLQSEVKAGDQVTITLPGGNSTPGTVTSVGKVASVVPDNSPGGVTGPTVPVTITATDPSATGNLDQAPVVVAITTRTVQDILAVPVNSLVALAGGGYAVEVVDGGTHRLVAVTPGLFDDVTGLVQVTASGLTAGQKVTVPAS